MNRIKPEIKLKKLSWERNKRFYECDNKGCNLEGRYKAPKSKIKLKEYYFFCLRHIKDYNKSWDYYKGMSKELREQDQFMMEKDKGKSNDKNKNK